MKSEAPNRAPMLNFSPLYLFSLEKSVNQIQFVFVEIKPQTFKHTQSNVNNQTRSKNFITYLIKKCHKTYKIFATIKPLDTF
jgi:hypothetical protein